MRIAQSADHKSREAKQRRLVRVRDIGSDGKPRCLLEIERNGLWLRCGRIGANQTVHIIKRSECGAFWDAPEVAILGCLECHRILDFNYLGTPKRRVRVPFQFAGRAWVFLLERHDVGELKIKPIARYNPFANDLYADILERVS